MTVKFDLPVTDEDGSQANATGISFGPLSVLARQKETWSPARVARLSWHISTNLPACLRIIRLLNRPAFKSFVQSNPRLLFKWAIRDYLVRGSSAAARAACFLHHYRRLHIEMPAPLLEKVLHRDTTVFEVSQAGARAHVTLGYSKDFEKEGELSLILSVDGIPVFVLSFTVVPGWAVNSTTADVLLISRLQGVRGFYSQIRLVTKALHDVAPAALLLAALAGFASAFGIDEIAGVCATRQSSYTLELASFYEDAYDSFFVELGLEKNSADFFPSKIPLAEKPLTSVKRGHKLRTKKKREFKRLVAENVRLVLLDEIAGFSTPPAVGHDS